MIGSNGLCDPYVWEYPTIIFKTNPFISVPYSCRSELINQIFAIVLIFIVFGGIVSLTTNNTQGLLVAFIAGLLFSIPNIIKIINIKKESENFADSDSVADSTRRIKEAALKVAEEERRKTGNTLPSVNIIGSKNSGISSELYETDPSAKNPFMNVLIDELKYNPTRPRAASVLDPSVKVQLDDFFRTEYFSDTTDVFGRSQSQRQFITMPATSIPNDVDSYQKWLYKIPGKTCKEGNPDACVPGTNGGIIPWLSK